MKGNITTKVPAELESAASNGVVVSSDGVYDYKKGKFQEDVNEDVSDELAEHKQDIEDLQAMEQIVIDGGQAQIAQGEDFDNPTTAKRAKIPTVGAVLDGMDSEPTAGSVKPVQSGGVFFEKVLRRDVKILSNTNYINLYNKDDDYCEDNSYINPVDGKIYSRDNLKVSGYIPVIAGNSYRCTDNASGHGYAFYDERGSVVSYGDQSGAMTAPAAASFLRVTLYMSKDGTENIVNNGTTLHSYVEYGVIDINSTNIPSYVVANIKSNIIDTVNIKQQGVAPNDCNFFDFSRNLYNKNDVDCVEGKYVISSNGNLSTNSTLKATGWIRVYPNLYYIANYPGQGAFYDKNKTYISGVASMATAFQAPENACWFRGSFKIDDDNVNRIVQSQTLLDYTDYVTPKIKDEYIGEQYKNKALFTPSVNLYDKDSSGCLDGKYMATGVGGFFYSSNATLKVSDFIKVSEGQMLYMYDSYNYAFFDDNKDYVSGSLTSFVHSTNAVTVPTGARYIRVTFYKNNEYQNRVCLNYLHPYVESGEIFKTPFYNVKNGRQYENMLGSTGAYVESASLQDTTLQLTSFPYSLHKGNKVGFEADIISFGSSDKFSVGKGTTLWGSNYLTITATNAIVYHYSGGTLSEIYNQAHGLTLSTYLKVQINQKANDTQEILIETLAGFYTININGYYAWNGVPFAKSEGCILTNCKLIANNSLLKSPLWAFGDSYYGETTENREMYWLKQWGYLNFLIQGYAGQVSTFAEEDLERCLHYGCPKRIIWSLGMNDDNVSVQSNIENTYWYNNYLKVKSICDNRNIELILTTIPIPASTNYKNKSLINTFIKSSDCGYRYIDACKAVGANSSGEWYGNNTEYDYQTRGNDNVHPSEYGAKAIATQFLIDAPEIMQCSL